MGRAVSLLGLKVDPDQYKVEMEGRKLVRAKKEDLSRAQQAC